MTEQLDVIFQFMSDVGQLKQVYRTAYLSDGSRHENSAEHSWHLAMCLLVFANEFPQELDLYRTLKMALIHDICEIDAGDISPFDPRHEHIHQAEQACIDRLAKYDLRFADELAALWHEFEAQQTPEARWVKVMDRFMPFLTNLMSHGKTWQEMRLSRSQVLKVYQPIQEHAPEIFAWMRPKIDAAVAASWLMGE